MDFWMIRMKTRLRGLAVLGLMGLLGLMGPVARGQTTNPPTTRGSWTGGTTNPPGSGGFTPSAPSQYTYPLLNTNGQIIWPVNFWAANSNLVASQVIGGVATQSVANAMAGAPHMNAENATNVFPDILCQDEGAKPILGFDTYYSGWNGSNLYSGGQTSIYCHPSEAFVLAVATNWISDGLMALGYNWISISDGWQAAARDGGGALTWDTSRFPNGIPWLVRRLHNMGFKVRMYTDLNTTTCCNALGTTNYPLDAATYTAWGIDSITVDTCGRAPGSDDAMRQSHQEFRAALAGARAHMIYDIHCAPVVTNGGNFALGFQPWMAGANSWQYTTEWGTLSDPWKDVLSHIDMAADTAGYMRPGHSPNLLIIQGDPSLLGGAQWRLMLSMWAMFQSPLVFAQDLVAYEHITGGVAKYQTNRMILAIDQDALWLRPWRTFTNGGGSEGWTKQLQDGSTALCVFNRGTNAETLSVDLTALGILTNSYAQMYDVWNYTNAFVNAGVVSMSSPGQGCSMWIISAAGKVTGTQQVKSYQVPAQQLINNGTTHYYGIGTLYDVLLCPTATTSWYVGAELPLWSRKASVSVNAYWDGATTTWTNRIRVITSAWDGINQVVEANSSQRITVTNGNNRIVFPEVSLGAGGFAKWCLIDAPVACTNGLVGYLDIGRMDVSVTGDGP